MSTLCIATYMGLAIDVGRQKLYYTDQATGMLGELSTDGTGHSPLMNISDEQSKPRGVVIDVDNR